MSDYTSRFYHQGEVVFSEGMPGNTAYLVRSGKVAIHRTVVGEQVPLADFGPGEIFGEMAVFLPGPRTATAVMVEAGDLILLPKDRFNAQLDEVPMMVKTLFHSLMERLAVTTQRLRPAREGSVFLSVSRILALQLEHLQGSRVKALPYRDTLRTINAILPASAADVEEVFFKLQDLGLVVCHKDGVPSKSLVFTQPEGFLGACERHYEHYADHMGEQADDGALDLDELESTFGLSPDALLAAAASGQLPLGLFGLSRARFGEWLREFPAQAQALGQSQGALESGALTES